MKKKIVSLLIVMLAILPASSTVSGNEDNLYNVASLPNVTASAGHTFDGTDINAPKNGEVNSDDYWMGDHIAGGLWYEYDLGKAYNIQKIELVTLQVTDDDPDYYPFRSNWDVIGYKEPRDAGTILGGQGATPVAPAATWQLEVSGGELYRYIRVQKTANEYMAICELRVMVNESEADIPEPEGIENATVKAVDFDSGANGVAYYDTTPGNDGSNQTYRPGTDVEIYEDNPVVSMQISEWLNYTLFLNQSNYKIKVNTASADGDTYMNVYVNGVLQLSNKTAVGTNEWLDFNQSELGIITVESKGYTVIRIENAVGNSISFSDFTIEQTTESPPKQEITLIIKAADFDEGANGVAYYDTTSGNEGSNKTYRPGTDVDIWEEPPVVSFGIGEWMNYTRQYEKGVYKVTVSHASVEGVAAITALLDGVKVVDNAELSRTSSWSEYKDVVIGSIEFPETKTYTLRFLQSASCNYSFASFKLELIANQSVQISNNLSQSLKDGETISCLTDSLTFAFVNDLKADTDLSKFIKVIRKDYNKEVPFSLVDGDSARIFKIEFPYSLNPNTGHEIIISKDLEDIYNTHLDTADSDWKLAFMVGDPLIKTDKLTFYNNGIEITDLSKLPSGSSYKITVEAKVSNQFTSQKKAGLFVGCYLDGRMVCSVYKDGTAGASGSLDLNCELNLPDDVKNGKYKVIAYVINDIKEIVLISEPIEI